MSKKDEPGVRQLDNVITVIVLALAVLPILAALAGLFGGLHDSSLANSLKEWNFSMDASTIINILIWCSIAYAIYWFAVIRPRKRTEFDASPEHPFKVKVTVAPVQTNQVLNFVRGRPFTYGLDIDVKISEKDWKRIKDMGFYDAVMFDYPNVRSTYDAERETFHLRSLHGGIAQLGFYNMGDAEEQKEKLLKGLYDLKEAIAVHKQGGGKRVESYEI